MVREQPRRIEPVPGRERVSDALDGVPVVSEPLGCLAVEVRDLVGRPSAEFEAQEIRQQLVVAKPGALRVERHDERVGVLQFEQHLFRAQAARQ